VTLYTIEYADADWATVIATFTKVEDRDETMRRIEAVPFRPARLMRLPERVVRVGAGEMPWRDHPADHSIHGHIFKGEMDISDAPLAVTDAWEDA
jgi:hypothetical protein